MYGGVAISLIGYGLLNSVDDYHVEILLSMALGAGGCPL